MGGCHPKLSGWAQGRQKKANERAEKQRGGKGTEERQILGVMRQKRENIIAGRGK